ncbi:hypothetical protein AKJ09_11421 [Labilithrix luteola]|uniref:Type IV fimbrial biogenesis protein PilY1 n=1 Tax=Labilithrix luteola TaxID=1391654 RepID=A0A0K1QGB7_9BACT|nr:hypothetical protein AKJ09_11421 [Labilithrix luteola]
MTRVMTWSRILLLASGTACAVLACSTTNEESAPIESDGGDSGETSIPSVPDAAPDVEDAAPDATEDADAGPRMCSDQGWCQVPLPAKQTLRGVWGDGQGIVWAVSAEGNVLRWDGKVWSIHVSMTDPLFAIWGSGPLDIWIGGKAGLFHSAGTSSAALSFEASSAPGDPTVPILSVWGTTASDVWAVGGKRVQGSPARSRVLHFSETAPGQGPCGHSTRSPASRSSSGTCGVRPRVVHGSVATRGSTVRRMLPRCTRASFDAPSATPALQRWRCLTIPQSSDRGGAPSRPSTRRA